MGKRKFRATEGLLHDVMRKQAGSVEKAILEAIMNSVDANATEVTVNIEETLVEVFDNGDGLQEDDVIDYFEQFGYKDDDIADKEFGKFRMGRGQIFNFGKNIWQSQQNLLLVDLNNEETEVNERFVGDVEDDDFIRMDGDNYVLDSGGLSYNFLDATHQTNGCRIGVYLYDELDDPESKADDVRDLAKFIPFVHDVELEINGNLVESKLTYPQETDLAWYDVNSNTYNTGAELYNKGARVGNFGDWPVEVTAISKEELDVNFARNEVLDTCDVWQEMQGEINEIVAHTLVQADDINSSQTRWLIRTAVTDDDVYDTVVDAPLVQDVEGKRWTLQQLKDETIVFASTRSEKAKKANRETQYVYIDKNLEQSLRELIDTKTILSFDDAWGSEMKWEMKEIDESKLSKKRGNRLKILRWVAQEIGCYDDVKSGMSSMENFWRDGEGTIYADKEFLNESKDEFFFEGLIEFVRVAAHDGSTMEEFSSDFAYKNNLHRYMKTFGEVQRKAYNGQAETEGL